MDKVLSINAKVCTFVGGGFMIGAFVISVVNPLTRFAIGSLFTWSQRGAVWTACFMAMLVAGVLVLDETHVSIDLIVDKIKGWPRKVIRIFNSVITVAFASFVLAGGISQLLYLKKHAISEVFGPIFIPYWTVFLFFSFGGFLLLTSSIVKVIVTIRE